MEFIIENIEQNNQISKQEFGQLVDLLYGSIAISKKDNTLEFQEKEQTLDFLLAFLKNYYESHVWESNELEGHFLDFLAKVQLQKEILQIASGQVKLKDVQSAINTFDLKSKFPVGMR